MCESCYAAGAGACTKCREPNVLMPGGKGCVAVDSKTGVCDASKVGGSGNATTSAGGWVFDNAKGVCDALPAKCLAGGINSFTSASTRAQLACSKCLPGSFLVNGACVDECPAGTMVSNDGTGCQACDSSCATCAHSTSFCTSCASSTALVQNGTCITGPSCPAGFFSSPSFHSPLLPSSPNTTAATCLPCHPDCATCSDTPTTCLTCPSSRPVFLASSSSCVSTCAPNEFFDSTKGQCVACDPSCASCASAGADGCLSCPSGQKLVSGRCEAPKDGCAVIDDFGVCLEDLVTVAPQSQSEAAQAKWKMPWWAILVLLICVAALVVVAVLVWRRREQRRRREQTARFARDLGNKEVDKKLAALPISIAYPPIPRAASPSPSSFSYLSPARPPPRRPSPPPPVYGKELSDVPLTPRFVLEDPNSPISPTPSRSSYAPSARPPLRSEQSRWSDSSMGTGRVREHKTGESARTFTTKAGNTLTIQSKNPYLGRI
ncbi:insulin-like growth factor binding protein [Rhodotorula toruloides]